MSEQKEVTKKDNSVYIDEDTVVSFFFGEIGWALQRWFAHLRYLKAEVYPDRKFIIMTDVALHSFVSDFIHITIGLPDELYKLDLDRDCYECVPVDSPSGSLTPPNIYKSLIEYFRNFYNVEKAIEIWPPRGCNFSIDNAPQIFCTFNSSIEIDKSKPIIVVLPRKRVRAAIRNVPEFIWKGVIDHFADSGYNVVLAGTPKGACLGDYNRSNVINLINYNEDNKTEYVIAYLNNALCSISSQSGGTHISLFSGCPSYIIGHENKRHSEDENRLDVPVTFRFVQDYRAIDVKTVIDDVTTFLKALTDAGYNKDEEESPVNRPSLRTLMGKKDLIGAEIGVDTGKNSLNILENLDIKKLYLIDPYCFYSEQRNIGQNVKEESNVLCKAEAHERLDEKYGDKIVWVEKQSKDSLEDIKEELDFVYIDGNHMYDYVMQDIQLYSNIVKNGGLVAGHDFDYFQVTKAVNDYSILNNISINNGFCQDTSKKPNAIKKFDWWFVKGESVEHNDYDILLQNDFKILDELIIETIDG